MDAPTKAQLEQLREQLMARQRELGSEIRAAEQARHEPVPSADHEVADQKDEAAQRLASALDEAQEQRDIDELAQVEAALRRIEAGGYGTCIDCGGAIPLQRLLVQPSALRCAACQMAREQQRSLRA
jgi:RNA polymerase-binding protein DksA